MSAVCPAAILQSFEPKHEPSGSQKRAMPLTYHVPGAVGFILAGIVDTNLRAAVVMGALLLVALVAKSTTAALLMHALNYAVKELVKSG